MRRDEEPQRTLLPCMYQRQHKHSVAHDVNDGRAEQASRRAMPRPEPSILIDRRDAGDLVDRENQKCWLDAGMHQTDRPSWQPERFERSEWARWLTQLSCGRCHSCRKKRVFFAAAGLSLCPTSDTARYSTVFNKKKSKDRMHARTHGTSGCVTVSLSFRWFLSDVSPFVLAGFRVWP